ncbi:MAG: 2-succinyl-5-enolpyruvyl-6-hydroxy-3-cyclohexene-1-carboxylate synthase [Puniceicoccaceae bacterium 5H]|nr:MAG: 2-succinyl-5-enolpyruvyl-6-hydroxy-3-cyclohexene-1-carboxylate synthase [Puniceicoccaceae bacterium 5H]
MAAAACEKLGVCHAVVSPGSRSTPLTHAFARRDGIELTPVLDERSAAFYALGLARATGKPTVLVCTSGSAAAHYLPAVIEASESRVPLLMLTADRPDELRYCRAGQTIDQVKLFGTYVRWFAEVRDPDIRPESLRYWRNLLLNAVERCVYPVAGPVHLNVPFREPLEPVDLGDSADQFEAMLKHLEPIEPPEQRTPTPELNGSGMIIAGPAQPLDVERYVESLKLVAEKTNWPILADALSPARHYTETVPNVISCYDLILRQENTQPFTPEQVLQVGELPTSKVLRRWLQERQLPTVVLDPGDVNGDAAHTRSVACRCTLEAFAQNLHRNLRMDMAHTVRWLRADKQARTYLRDHLKGTPPAIFEGAVVRVMAAAVPDHTPVYVASSTPVRDFEWFWAGGDRKRRIYFNRGANGIDGTLSTALGIMQGLGKPGLLYTGDLALLHDTNGLLVAASRYFKSALTIVCINNSGGGIFEHLPISQQNEHFEALWATPQPVHLQRLAAAYDLAHELIEDVDTLRERLEHLPDRGVRLLEVQTDRKRDAGFRQKLFADFALPNEPNS